MLASRIGYSFPDGRIKEDNGASSRFRDFFIDQRNIFGSLYDACTQFVLVVAISICWFSRNFIHIRSRRTAGLAVYAVRVVLCSLPKLRQPAPVSARREEDGVVRRLLSHPLSDQ